MRVKMRHLALLVSVVALAFGMWGCPPDSTTTSASGSQAASGLIVPSQVNVVTAQPAQ